MKKKLVAAVLTVLVLLGAAGLGVMWSDTHALPVDATKGVLPIEDEASTPTVEDVASQDQNSYVVVSEYEAVYTTEQLMDESTLVAWGTVTEQSEPFVVRGVGEIGEQVFTDYTVEIQEVTRGTERPGDFVTVRLEGDPADTSVVYSSAPVLETGGEYLLFLRKSCMGGGFSTPGDYYYIVGNRQGVYEPEQSAVAQKAALGQEAFVSQRLLLHMDTTGNVPQIRHNKLSPQEIKNAEENGQDIVTLSALQTIARAASPVDEDWKRQEVEANYKTNLETGILTEEEYNTLMAELNQYGEIME